MEAVILAGGLGTRLRPLTYHRPKPLLPLVDRTIIEHVMGPLEGHVDRIILSTGYRSSEFEDMLEVMGERVGARVLLAHEDKPLGTGGGIRNAYAYTHKDRIVVLNGDIISGVDIGDIIAFHEAKGSKATIMLRRVKDSRSYGAVRIDKEGRVLEFREKPAEGSAFSDLINAGIYVLEAEIMDMINLSAGAVSIEREIFPRALERGMDVFGYVYDGYWLDVGTPERLLEAQKLLMDRMNPGDKWDDGWGVTGNGAKSNITHPVYVDGGNIHETALVGPYISIYNGAVVEAGAKVSNAMILPNARIGRGAVVEGTIVGYNGMVKPGEKVINAGIYM